MTMPSPDWLQQLASLANMPDGVFVVDAQGLLLGVNDAFCRITGRERDDMLGRNLASLALLDDEPAPMEFDCYRARWHRPDGRRINVEISATRNADGLTTTCWVHDITDLIAATNALRRGQALLEFLIAANALIARAEEAGTLYSDICALATQLDERIALAWVGMTDPATARVRVAAHAGRAGAYLDGLEISTAPSLPQGQGPTATAIRENRLVIVNRFNDSPLTLAWRERARHNGLAASVSIPIRRQDQPIGALMLYSSEEDIFDTELSRLLEELGGTLSHALDFFAQRDEARAIGDALRQSEQRYRLLADNIRDVIWIYDVEAQAFTYVSRSVEAMRGYTPAEAMRQSLDDILTPDSARDVTRWLDDDIEAFQAGTYRPRMAEVEQRNKDGSTLWTEITTQIVKDAESGRLQIFGVSRDINSRRAAERRFREVVELATEGIAMVDPAGRLILVNQRFHAMLGYPDGALLGRLMLDMVAPEDQALFGERFADIAGGHRTETREARYALLHRDGHRIHVLLSATHRHDADGRYQGSVGMVTDISTLVATEQALRDALQVVEASPVVRFRWRATPNLPVAYVSDNISRWGYRAEDIVAGRPPFTELIHPDDLPRVSDEITRDVAAGKTEYVQEYRLRHADGHYFWVEDNTRIKRDVRGGAHFHEGVVTDIDTKKRYQEELTANLAHQRELNAKLEEAHNQLLQSEKMASIGQLAAGVAHELNNPIGFVHSNLGTLDTYLRDIFDIVDAYEKAEVALGDQCPALEDIRALKTRKDYDFMRQDISQLMNESRDGLNRVRKIVQDLKDFSRVGDTNWQMADIHEGIESTLNIVWNELKYKSTVTKHYATDLPQIRCLPSQLNQVFMNLLVNAAHAIEPRDGKLGEIAITTRRLGDDAIQIEVRDTGKGIAEEHLKRIFEPFFTTKPVGKGTGLGLSIAWGIIGRHHGRIEVHSTPGAGTTFTITLPVRGGDAEAPPSSRDTMP